MPGSSPTIDRREPVSRLKSVDLPTFGRPQTAINGSFRASSGTGFRSVTIWDASNSISRHSCSSSPSRSPRPATLAEFGVRRPTIPSAGRAAFFGVTSGRIVRLLSFSGDRFDTRLAAAFFAAVVASTLRLRGSTAPVVGVDFGARPFFGRVAACRCFLPSRFLSSRCAMSLSSGHRGAFSIIGTRLC